MIYVIIYIVGGLLTNFLSGYNAPVTSKKDGMFVSWVGMITWPAFFPISVKNFGMVLRMGEKA